jgi:hypothetical protein
MHASISNHVTRARELVRICVYAVAAALEAWSKCSLITSNVEERNGASRTEQQLTYLGQRVHRLPCVCGLLGFSVSPCSRDHCQHLIRYRANTSTPQICLVHLYAKSARTTLRAGAERRHDQAPTCPKCFLHTGKTVCRLSWRMSETSTSLDVR